ncbi:MAG TPA: trypsin-like peptidase domain-containing protein, partial [Candidatus Bathyarchaeia archaeon]|nr:trypsin-like peptidase domain-containing protein [Candidatus Bathyarchaeia archaeon]
MNKTQMMILFSVSIGLLLFSLVTEGPVGVVAAFSTVHERHEFPVSVFMHNYTTQPTAQIYPLPIRQNMQNLHFKYFSLTKLTTLASSTPLTDIFKRVENSVVQITNRVNDTGLQIIINGNHLQGQSTKLGSGFVYDDQGRIVTNDHVVNGAKTVDVVFVDGNTYTAKVIGTDPSSDLAVLQITD